MNISTATAKGRRPYQEDGFNVIEGTEGTLLAVFDGHGGTKTMNCAVENLLAIWSETFDHVSTPEERLAKTIKSLDELTSHNDDGSTASLVFVNGDGKAYCAVLGDSPILIRDKDGKVHRSPEHNVRSNQTEANRAMSRGGVIYNGYLCDPDKAGGLQMSRALGDRELDKVLDRTPEIYTVELNKDSWILVGTDGILDPGHETNNIDDLLDMISKEANAEDIVKSAVDLPTHDNATAIMVRL